MLARLETLQFYQTLEVSYVLRRDSLGKWCPFIRHTLLPLTEPYIDICASAPNVIICLDGNMQHRQYSSIVGDLILDLDEFSIFIPDSVVEGSKQHVLNCQSGNSRSLSYRQSVNTPLGAVDACATSHKAAIEQQDAGNVDDTYCSIGLMACLCCHNIPLFLCDIGTPREQHSILP